MKKIIIISLILVMVITLAGCNLIEVSPERDRETVVIKVEGNAITKGELNDLYSNLAYNNYRISPDELTDPETKKYIMDAAKDQIIAQEIIKIKAEEYGCYDFTAEENEQVDTEINESLSYYKDLASGTVTSNEENADKSQEDIDALIEEEYLNFIETIGFDEEVYRKAKLDQIAAQKLYDIITETPALAESELLKEYDLRVVKQRAGFEEGSQNYESLVASRDPIYYHIPGVRTTRHILISLPDDVKTQISAHRNNGDNDLADELLKESLLEIENTANEAYELAIGDSDFDELIVEYGEDPGMSADNYYSLTKDSVMFVSEFTKGLFLLKSKGDISKPVATDFGYHIILYLDDVVEGPVPFEDVRDSINDEIEKSAKDLLYSDQLTAWKDEMKIKIYNSKID